VRPTLSLLGALLLVVACKRQEHSADKKIQKTLPGTWVFEARYASGSSNQSKVEVAQDASYVSTLFLPGRTNGPRTIHQEGTWRVKDAILSDIITKDSQTNAPVPNTKYARIISIDDQNLVLDYVKIPGVVYPTNQTVFREQAK
jgi:hypothetical protein